MKFFMKRTVALVLFALFMINSAALVSAATYHDIAISGKTRIFMNKVDGADKVDANGKPIGNSGMNGYTFISFNGGSKATFRINILKRGAYDIALALGAASQDVKNFTVSIDDGEKTAVSAGGGLGFYEPAYTSVMTPVLEEGNHTITLTNVNASLHLMGIEMSFLAGDMVIEDCLANNVSIKDAFSVPYGADSFKIRFSELLSEESVNDETVFISYSEDGETKKVAADVLVSDKDLTVALKETLKNGVLYKLSINGVKDKYFVTTIENQEYNFIADSSAISNGSIEAMADVTYGDAVVKGKYISSEGIGISGRNVKLYLNEITGESLAEATTDENGEFTMEYVFAESVPVGKNVFIIDGDFVIEPCSVEVIYMTKEKEKELLSGLSKMTESVEVENFFKDYETIIGVDLSEDLKNITSSVPVFEGLLNKTFEDAETLRKEFYTYIALETINQTEDKDILDSVLSNETDCKLLGIDYDRINLIVNKREAFLEEVIALDSIKEPEDFVKALRPVTEKWLAEEYGFMDIAPFEEDKSVYEGKGIEITLGFEEKIEYLSRAVFDITVSDERMLLYLKHECEQDVKASVKCEDKKITVDAVCSGNGAEKLVVLYLTAPDDAGEYTVKYSGKAYFENENKMQFETNITEKIIKVSVKNPPKEGGGKVNSSSSGRAPSGGGMSISDYKEKTDAENTEKEEAKYKFSDLSNVSWAEESINTLLNKGVISKSEDKKFYPERNVTREEFAKMLVCALGLENENAVTSLTDLDENAWYYPYIASAYQNGIITGNENGEFGLGKNITRQDMSVMVCRALLKLQFENSGNDEKFADDESISAYAKEAVYMMKSLGIINGVGDNMFAPKENATRAQAAKIICSASDFAKQ